MQHPSRTSSGEFAAVSSPQPSSSAASKRDSLRTRWRNFSERYNRFLWVGAAVILALAVVLTHAALMPRARDITQEDINAAVLHTLENNALPSPAAKAYEVVRPSIVRVRRFESDKAGGEDLEADTIKVLRPHFLLRLPRRAPQGAIRSRDVGARLPLRTPE